MTATYDCIATTTLSSAQSSVTFSSISGSFTDLVLIIAGTSTVADRTTVLQFNSDTGTNYSWIWLNGNGSSVSSQSNPNENWIAGGSTSTEQSISIAHIMNYANTTTNKTVLSRGTAPSNRVRAHVGLWRNTSAITSIVVKINDNSNFSSGTVFSLYGIKAE